MIKRRITVIATIVASGLGIASLSAAAFAPTPALPFTEPTVNTVPTVTDWHQTHYRLYGLLDLQHAQQMGYHSYGTKSAIEAKYNDEHHSADYYNVVAAFSGGGVYQGQRIPEGGCIAQARRAVEGASVDPDLPSKLNFASWTSQNSDSRVKAGFAAWSKCMSRVGFSYDTPRNANNDDRWSTETASQEEIAVAVADVNCKKETNLVGIRMAVDSSYQRLAIAAHGTKLKELKSSFARQLNTANVLIADATAR